MHLATATSEIGFNEDLIHRLPLPLAQLYRRAHNARTPLDRYNAAYNLWEASLKLLSSVAIALGRHDPEVIGRLHFLAKAAPGESDALQAGEQEKHRPNVLENPSLGHWWGIARYSIKTLAEKGDPGFERIQAIMKPRRRNDMPRAAQLDCVLTEVLQGRASIKTTVWLMELYDHLVEFRNKQLGHGAPGQASEETHERVGRTLLAGVSEVLVRMDPLAGRQMWQVDGLHRDRDGAWLAERSELRGENLKRLAPLVLADREMAESIVPGRIYLDAAHPRAQESGENDNRPITPLYPLLFYKSKGESGEVFFLNGVRGEGTPRLLYLSHNSNTNESVIDETGEFRNLTRASAARPDSLKDTVEMPRLPKPAATSVPAAPSYLGEFELLAKLGEGAMGKVYRARQPGLDRDVALKELRRSGNPQADARFASEVRALGQVEHPNLVEIYTSGMEGERWFYAMELVRGATLADVCKNLQGKTSRPEEVNCRTWQEAVSTVCATLVPTQGSSYEVDRAGYESGERKLNVDRPPQATPQFLDEASYVGHVVELVRQVAEAAQALHDEGILHRDIKPSNIMVTVDGAQAVLMDLGAAKFIDDEMERGITITRQLVGTPRYASPEQLAGAGGLDRRSDVYNLGATLWELLTLQPMFGATEETSINELLRRIPVEDPEPPRKYHLGLSRDLEAIVLKCLEKQPQKRYQTAIELAQDLERFQHGEPVAARRITDAERVWRWCRRRPVVSGLIASLLVVILGSLAGMTALFLNAEEERKRAEHNLAVAKQAVDEMLVQVGDEKLKDIPQMEQLRTDLFGKAKDFYEQLRKQEPSDKSLRLEIALSSHRIGDVWRLLDDRQRSEEAYQDAIRRLGELHQEFPDDPIYHRHEANSYNWLGVLLKPRDPKAAQRAYESAMRIQQEVLRDLPADSPLKRPVERELARSTYNRGIVHAENDLLPEARQDYEAAMTLLGKLAKDAEKEFAAGCSQELARCHNNLANVVARQAGDANQKEAAKHYQRAIEIVTELRDQNSGRREYREERAAYLNNLTNLWMAGDTKNAENQNSLALAEWDGLALAIPKIRNELANAHHSRGMILGALRQVDEAEQELQLARRGFAALVDEVKADQKAQYLDRHGNALFELAKLKFVAREAFQEAASLVSDAVTQHTAARKTNLNNADFRQHLSNDYFLLAWSRAKLAQFKTAVETMAEYRKLGPNAPDDIDKAADVLSWTTLIADTKVIPDLTDGERVALSEDVQAAAVQLIGATIDNCTTSALQKQVSEKLDGRFDALRSRADFIRQQQRLKKDP